ncbi:M18 family aminopeptidase [Pseudomonas sp. MYb185]|uniref:M18 family aminopeptidase n=1 Tax=Pseudomonas sp. MYb185 TaxID=1848729 RepID=UPI000CFB7C9C|nr:M18 family aminopeptidase [Pseudomonas sp. MYb185]PRB80474.1 M18 family aminopeptidase [Pseudomonas sp. MYb185]
MPHSAASLALADFIQASPTPFHAAASLAARLQAAGYQQLDERDEWSLQQGGRYYVLRNQSSLIAFSLGQPGALDNGLRMIGAHTDSPCLRVKPQPELSRHGLWQLGVEVYGGALLAPWFDRDLSLAGRVTCRDDNGQLHNLMLDFKRPIAIIPSLAIHLNRDVNSGFAVNPQTDLPPVLAHSIEPNRDLRALLASELSQRYPERGQLQVLDYELSFYDTQPPAMIGLDGDFLAAARLDNLLSCHAGLEALLASDTRQACLLVCTDHEEVGSSSACGADGPFLEDVLKRLLPNEIERIRAIQRSVLVSADNAHAIHPNYADRHDGNHGPQLNAGPVIKINSNQRYATTSETAALFRHLCQQVDVPVQSFVVRSDMGCGSTIGPITSSRLGVRTVDIGAPTFAMHSIRELAGVRDVEYLQRVLTAFLDCPQI